MAIATELNSGMSITNAAEEVWSNIIDFYPTLKTAMLIEHYDEIESYGNTRYKPQPRHRFYRVVPQWDGDKIVKVTRKRVGQGDDFEKLVELVFKKIK
jgi:hypothetical protein